MTSPVFGPPFALGDATADPAVREQHFADLAQQLAAARFHNLAYPGFTDITHPALGALLTGQLLNNVGDPYDGGHGHDHTKTYERDVINHLADLFGAPASRWGYVTSGSSEGTDHALWDARLAFPGQEPVVLASTAAHYSVAKACNRHRLTLIHVRTDPGGRMDIGDLRTVLGQFRHRPVVIVATVGTTMTEAYDDVADIATVCDDLAIVRRRIHVDAALSALPLALLPAHERPAFDFSCGATSIVNSGHKFLSTLTPCAVLIYAEPPVLARTPHVPYTGTADTTIGGSRNGHNPLRLWSALSHGLDVHRGRAERSRDLAAYTHDRLLAAGWPASRGPHAMTVVIAQPPARVCAKWVLAPDGTRAHIICKPDTDPAAIDEFVHDLTHPTTVPATPRQPAAAVLPSQVSSEVPA
ncbi:pyridoxal-dependent decarboxylase [Paractinoplanes hotanensis]|uniref:Pyridoxal-dependent decarboxylase n=1 Tax=Paractinoplanes hotanensis TaxID=2906497 RepID=A0ABT0Y858_9ACTN|nr:pyridoxal-dependent decarboxylase [Actinoplanes hotanensis]MCM4082225.1 pyridoxal-dependent decarboxylase [Actinoplanes hotanensis]